MKNIKFGNMEGESTIYLKSTELGPLSAMERGTFIIRNINNTIWKEITFPGDSCKSTKGVQSELFMHGHMFFSPLSAAF